jgi:hypothetical protein
MGLFKNLTGFDGIGDMFDGGGAGGSGENYFSGTHQEYKQQNPKDKTSKASAPKNNSSTPAWTNPDTGNTSTWSDSGKMTVKTPEGDKIKGTGGGLLSNHPAVAVLSFIDGTDASDQGQVVGNRMVFTKADGTKYSKNVLGLAYDIKTDENGQVVVDDSGNPVDGTDYSKIETLQSSGNSKAAAVGTLTQAINAAEASGRELTSEEIIEMARQAGVIDSNEDIKELLADPKKFLEDRDGLMSGNVPQIDPNAEGTTLDSGDYTLGDTPTLDPALMEDVSSPSDIEAKEASTFEASTTTDLLGTDATTVDAASMEVTDNHLVDPEDLAIDMQGSATGVNTDGTNNVVGTALNNFASQDISTIIDTTTVSGKLLAQKLGEGNYTDSKATILGQMAIISEEFKDSQGNATIPVWAQPMANSVKKAMAFGDEGLGTGTTIAMSNAIMQATLGVAKEEATFFQTLTTQNLSNRQQQIMNKANVLAEFEVANLDARQNALVNNAKAFQEIDLTNLNNEQQSEIINTQAMFDAILSDQSAINAQRLFTAENNNDFSKFYDNIQLTIDTFRSEQINASKRFNAGEINDSAEFEASMEDSRQKFYTEFQYNVDKAVAGWKQSVETGNKQMMYEALSADVKNILDISQEAQNQLWDRVDSMFDKIWTTGDNEATRDVEILKAQIVAQSGQKDGKDGWDILGAIGGSLDWNEILGIG